VAEKLLIFHSFTDCLLPKFCWLRTRPDLLWWLHPVQVLVPLESHRPLARPHFVFFSLGASRASHSRL